MGIFDALVKNPKMIGDVAKFAKDNPQVAKAAMSLFSNAKGSVGGTGGLGGILSSLQKSGMGDAVASWLGNGPNQAVSAKQLQSALGSDTLAQFAEKAGVSSGQASSVLAGLLPGIVDKLSPNGQLPDAKGLDSVLGGLMGELSKRA